MDALGDGFTSIALRAIMPEESGGEMVSVVIVCPRNPEGGAILLDGVNELFKEKLFAERGCFSPQYADLGIMLNSLMCEKLREQNVGFTVPIGPEMPGLLGFEDARGDNASFVFTFKAHAVTPDDDFLPPQEPQEGQMIDVFNVGDLIGNGGADVPSLKTPEEMSEALASAMISVVESLNAKGSFAMIDATFPKGDLKQFDKAFFSWLPENGREAAEMAYAKQKEANEMRKAIATSGVIANEVESNDAAFTKVVLELAKEIGQDETLQILNAVLKSKKRAP